MDKKTGIIVGIIAAVVAVLIAMVFVIEGNTEKVDNNTILTINGVNYSIDEFRTFAKIYNYEKGDINEVMSEQETLSMLDQFLMRKLYYTSALKNKIELESGDLEHFGSNYDKDAITFLSANISKDDYIKYETEETMEQNLKNNFGDYYTLPDGTYDAIKENFKNSDEYKTYSFRLMSIPYELPKSGDSGDANSESNTESGDKEDLSRDAQLLVAENVLARIKSGDDFEALAKEYGSTRISFKGNQYVLINGDLEYATSPLLESKLGSHEVYHEVLELSSGEVTDVIEDTEYTSFQIVKVESVEEGFVGEGEKELKEVLLNEYANDLVATDSKYEMNQAAFLRMMYK